MRIALTATSAFAIGIAFVSGTALASPSDVAGARASITAAESLEHVEYLASDALEGRGAGTEGGLKAAKYIASQFEASGIEPFGDDGTYFQAFGSGERAMRNVVGLFPGSDPNLKDEFVVIGAHYDHLGHGGYGSLGGEGIHNGADDNASGTTGVIEIAEALAELAPEARPRRSIVLILFDGEELGLLGSNHFVGSGKIAIEKTIAMLNMDMIGRSEGGSVRLYGATSGSNIPDKIKAANEAVGLTIDYQETFMPNSDHAAFYQKNIPALAFFTGLHGDYHRPGDDVEKVNPEGIQDITRVCFSSAIAIANDEERPAFNRLKGGGLDLAMEQLRSMFGGEDGGGGEGLQKMLEGLFGGGDGEGPGGEGLQKMLEGLFGGGDGEGPGGGEGLQKMLEGLFGGRGDGEGAPDMPFGQPQKPKLGVRISESPEADGVVIDQITPDSPAERAGLQVGDVILELDGQATADFPSLRAAVQGAGGQIKARIQRDGAEQSIEIDFGGGEKPEKPKKKKRILI